MLAYGSIFLRWADLVSQWKQDIIVIQHAASADGRHTNIFLKMTDTIASHNTDLFFLITLYMNITLELLRY